jgi:two-component system, OmpR family, phosphate regulon sensor histidine kinase PhoR
VCCRDSGIGIPEADLPQLFSRFYRAGNAASAAIPGTGLGLAIVKTIVEDHGGHLDLSSVEGEGTVVVIELPLAAGA